ncbi:AAA family ATPase [Dactylosporangium sp. NBC_01737]|nr:AAA family ATPase [Dactylosporangium sp. NBC_01737]
MRRYVAEQPAREAARGQLMLALYRAGQQTEALAVFDEGRRFLAEEFGVEPGAELRALHRQILAHTVPDRQDTAERPSVGERSPGGLVGRSAELAVLGGHLDAARRDGGRMVAVVGEAGIGKTTLATAVAGRAAAAGIPVVWGRCPDVGQAPPFWLWSQIVRGLLALPHAGTPGAALTGFVDGPSTQDGGLDPAARFRAYEAVSDLVRAAAAPAGLVLVLDDLHAADPDSLLLTRYLTTTVHTGHALVVATLRPYEHDPALVATLNDLARGAGSGQLRLGGLDAAGVADLVADRTGEPAPEGLVRRLAERTGGNPFFLTELLARHGEALPPSVRDAVRLRLDGPDPATRECLDVLGVAGRELGLHLLRAVTGADAAQLLAGPAAAQLVTEAGPGTVRFRHPLFAEVAYAELPAPRRAALHARLATAAAQQGGLTAGEIAHHYGQSIGLGHAEDFLRWTVRAADDAARRLAYEDALAHLQRAADHLAPDAATAPDAAAAELGVQLRRAALLQITVGVGSDAVAAAAARARWLLPYTGPDTDVRTALWTLGEVACNRAEYAVAEDLARRLTDAAPPADGLVAAAGPYLLGVVCYFTGRLAAADGHLTAAADRLAAFDPRHLRGAGGPDAGARRVQLPGPGAVPARRPRRGPRRPRRGLGARGGLRRPVRPGQRRPVRGLDRPAGARRRRGSGRGPALPRGRHPAGHAALRHHRRLRGRVGGGARRRARRPRRDAGGRRGDPRPRAARDPYHLDRRDGGRAPRCRRPGHRRPARHGRPRRGGGRGERVLTAELRRVRGLATGDPDDVRAGAAIAADQGARLLLDRIDRGGAPQTPASQVRYPHPTGPS